MPYGAWLCKLFLLYVTIMIAKHEDAPRRGALELNGRDKYCDNNR